MFWPICDLSKDDDQGLLFRVVRGSIMTSTSGENTMIQGLNTNIDISLPMFRLFSFVFFLFCFFEGWSMAVAEEDSSLFNKDNWENWLLVDSDASFSYAISSKDCTPTATVPLFSRTECSLLLYFVLGNSGSSCCFFEDIWEKSQLPDSYPSLLSSESSSTGIVNFFFEFFWSVLC